MKLSILGSGNFLPDTDRNCSSYLLESGKEKLLFDCGRGAISSLIKLKINPYSITRIFISHRHTDHLEEIGSFMALVIASSVKNKFNKNKLYIYGPGGIRAAITSLLKAYDIYSPKNIKKIVIREIKDKRTIKLKNLEVSGFEVSHSDSSKCLSYRVQAEGKIIAYSGDSKDCQGLRNTCKNADLAIIEATLPKSETHLSGEQAGNIARVEGVKELILTHIDKDYLINVISDARKEFRNGEIRVAHDLLQLEF